MISVIIPVYNEENTIGAALECLLHEKDIEIIVVDGQSTDKTKDIIRNYPVKYINTIKGRACQLNEGAKVAKGNAILFLHADCFLEEGSIEKIKETIDNGSVGGCLSQSIDSGKAIYRFIEASGNMRARVFKIFYGDQAIFVRKDIFYKMGGFDLIELFDDVTFSKKLKLAGKSCILDKKVYTSARRWEKQGVIKTTAINWVISVGFLFGISHQVLKSVYPEIR